MISDMTHRFSRRGLFAAGAAAALAPRISQTASAAEPGFSLGVATYSLRNFTRPGALAILKKLRVDKVSIKEMHLPYRSTPEELTRGMADFKKAGIAALSAGNNTMTKEDMEDLRFYFKYAQGAGIPMLVIAPSAATVPMIEKLVKEYNIKVAIHNHGPEDKHFPTPQSVLAAIRNMDPRVGLCLDIGHTTRTGTDIVEAAKEAGPRLLDLHVKDLRDLMDKDSQCDVGDGKMPIVALFRQLQKMKYTGGVMLEYEINADDPYPGMAKSLSYMRGVMAALSAA
ncbi:MAG TPA: sugar phosphate isomerase/epimerase [Solibacterales bacterium]|nr:sugar phosphate isomerase/epimerase [Bryobacterales bacterium]